MIASGNWIVAALFIVLAVLCFRSLVIHTEITKATWAEADRIMFVELSSGRMQHYRFVAELWVDQEGEQAPERIALQLDELKTWIEKYGNPYPNGNVQEAK